MPVVSVKSSGASTVGRGAGSDVRCGFVDSAVSSAAEEEGGVINVMSEMPMRWHQSNAYQTIGLFAIGMSALGKSLGFAVNGCRDSPGPQRMRA